MAKTKLPKDLKSLKALAKSLQKQVNVIDKEYHQISKDTDKKMDLLDKQASKLEDNLFAVEQAIEDLSAPEADAPVGDTN